MAIRSQTMAQAAFRCVHGLQPISDEYRSFAREFPTLVHQCGLGQAVAFAQTRGGHQEHYACDLAAVLTAAGHKNVATVDDLADRTRQPGTAVYIRLSRDALKAAIWIKRYVEALHRTANPSDDQQQRGNS